MKLITLIMMLITSVPALSAPTMKKGFCIDELNNELDALEMGTFDNPVTGVDRTPEHDRSVTFNMGVGKFPVTVQIQKILKGTRQRLSVEIPSTLFPPYESKEITFNEKCEVVAIDMTAGGRAAHFDAEDCRKILAEFNKPTDNHEASLIRAVKTKYPKHEWSQCSNVYSEAALNLCKRYSNLFPEPMYPLGKPKDDKADAPAKRE